MMRLGNIASLFSIRGYRLLAAGVLLVCISCRKNSKTDRQETGSNYSFLRSVELPANFYDWYTALTYPGNKFFIYSYGPSGNFLTRCNDKMEIEHTKKVVVPNQGIIGICGSKNSNNLYLLSSGNFSITRSPDVMTAYACGAFMLDSVFGCDAYNQPKYYTYTPNFSLTNCSPASGNVVLQKFDEDGNELWSRTMDGHYFAGHALETDLNGDVYAITFTWPSPLQTLNSSFTGLVPYYYERSDSCKITLHRFDKDGNELYNKVMKGVKAHLPDYSIGLALSKNAIYVYSSHDFFVFNRQGDLISKRPPGPDKCYAGYFRLKARPDVKTVFVSSEVRYTSTSETVKWYRHDGFNGSEFYFVEEGAGIIALDSLGSFYVTRVNDLIKKSVDGAVIYHVPKIRTNPFVIFNEGFVDKYQFFYGFINGKNGIDVYKFDNNGNLPFE